MLSFNQILSWLSTISCWMPHFKNLNIRLLPMEQANMMDCWLQQQKTYSSASPTGEVPGTQTQLSRIMYHQNEWEPPAHSRGNFSFNWIIRKLAKASWVCVCVCARARASGNWSENSWRKKCLGFGWKGFKNIKIWENQSKSWLLKNSNFYKEYIGSLGGCWSLVSINKIYKPSPDQKKRPTHQIQKRCSKTFPLNKYTKLSLKTTALGTTAIMKSSSH